MINELNQSNSQLIFLVPKTDCTYPFRGVPVKRPEEGHHGALSFAGTDVLAPPGLARKLPSAP